MAFPPGFKPYGDTPEGFQPYGDTPEGFKPNEESEPKKKESEGFLSSIIDKGKEFLSEHPTIRRYAQEFLTGDSPEKEEMFKKAGVTGGLKGPGLMAIPGVDKVTDWLANKITGSEGDLRLAAGAVTKAIGDVISTGFDPRNVAVQRTIRNPNVVDVHDFTSEPVPSEPPVRQPITAADRLLPVTRSSTEIPYRAEPAEPVPYEPTGIIQRNREALAASRGQELPPEMLTPEDLDTYNRNAPRTNIKDTDQMIYDMARDKTGGQELPDDLAVARKPDISGLTDADVTADDIRSPAQRGKAAMDLALREPQMARTKEGNLKLGADVESLGQVLGTSLYKGDIAPIATKELLQNAIDATRHLGADGKVDVHFANGDNQISVSDNGKGMTRRELETVFTDLGASGKRSDVNASGGFGLAKAAPLLGTDRFKVVSVAKEPGKLGFGGRLVETSFEGTPDDLIKGKVKVKQRNVPDGAQTGTHVTVTLPEHTYTDGAEDFVQKAALHSYGLTQQIRTGKSYLSTKGIEGTKVGDFGDMSDPRNPKMVTHDRAIGKQLATIDSPTSKTDLIIPNTSVKGNHDRIVVHMLNNGMYQGSYNKYIPGGAANIPSELSVDIHSKVPEGHKDYPFTANREELRGPVENEVEKYISENLITPSNEHRKNELARMYDNMPFVNVAQGEFPHNFGTKVYMYDPKGQLSPMEMREIVESPSMSRLAKSLSDALYQASVDFASKSGQRRLERFGFIFQDGIHGIHIPNPKTNKSVILINPFLSLNKPADQAAANLLHTVLHELVHTDDKGQGHNENFTVLLGEIYARFGAQSSMAFQNRIIDDLTADDSGKYNPDVQEVLQRYTESRGRAATQEDLLVGTGIKSRSKFGGEGDVPEGYKSNGERTAAAVNKLLNALEEAKNLEGEQAEIYRRERARRFARFEGVKEGGRAGAAKSLGKLRGEYTKVEGEGLPLSDEDADILFNAIKRAIITPGEKARAYTALFKLLEGGNVPQRSEIAVLDSVFGDGFGSKIIEMQGGLGAVSIPLAKAANAMKSMMTMIHFTAPLRQGLGLIHTEPWRKNIKEMFKFFGNEKYYNAAMQSIKEHPYYLLSREAKLFLAEPKSLSGNEEEFANNLISDIPRGFSSKAGLGTAREIYEASQRSYTGFLNKLRFDLFRDYVNEAKMNGEHAWTVETENGKTHIIPTKLTHDIAKMINIATARGSLGKFGAIAPELNSVIWSPRKITARLQSLNPYYYASLDKFAKRKAIKALLAAAAGSAAILGVAKAIGGKVGIDPSSPDFWKARFKNTTLDPGAGYQQQIVAASKMIVEANRLAQKKKPRYGEDSIPEIGMNYLRGQETPAAHLADSILTAKQWTGGGTYTDRFGKKTSVPSEVLQSFTPIFLKDLRDLYQDDPSFVEFVGLSGANLFGTGLHEYPERGYKAPNRMRLNMGMRMPPSH